MATKDEVIPFPLGLHLSHMNDKGQLQKDIRELVNFIEEERDFWEWLEDEIGETRKDLFEKYEAYIQTTQEVKP